MSTFPSVHSQAAGGALQEEWCLAPAEFFPRLSKKPKKKLHVRYSSHVFPLGSEQDFQGYFGTVGSGGYAGWTGSLCSSGPWFSTVLNLHGYIRIILGILDVSVTICVLQRLLNISAAGSPHMVQEEGIFGGVMVALYPGKTPRS